ncbi:MAG: carboxypeptidase M32, partial [Bacteroidota bacterium]
MTSTPALARLKRRLGEVADLNAAIAVLGWDQETYLPAGAANARAEQLATLEKLAHEMLTSAETLDLLSEAEAGTSLSKAEQALLRVTRRDVDQATKLPTQLVSDLARATSQALHAWKTARADDAFSAFAPHLETVVQLSRDKADALGYAGERYDALLDLYEPGMTATELDVVF